MDRIPLFIGLTLAFFSNCKSSNDLPSPIYSAASCQIQDLHLNFDTETYSLNSMPFESFNQKIVGWIPAEDDPTFYIISYHIQFCDFLELNLDEYSYVLEEIGNPDGYWYEITTSEELFLEILAGKIIQAKFKKWGDDGLPTDFVGPVYD